MRSLPLHCGTMKDLPHRSTSRRDFIGSCAVGSAALALTPILRWGARTSKLADGPGPASQVLNWDRDWLFGGMQNRIAGGASQDRETFTPITLPHCVARL